MAFSTFIDELNQANLSAQNFAGKISTIGNTFKTTNDPMLRFIRNLGYGQFGLFRPLNTIISAFDTLNATIITFTKGLPAIQGGLTAVGNTMNQLRGNKFFDAFEFIMKGPLAAGSALVGVAGATGSLIKDSLEGGEARRQARQYSPAALIEGTMAIADKNNPMKGAGSQNLIQNLMKNKKMTAISITMYLLGGVLKFIMGTFVSYLYTVIGTVLLGIAAVALFVGAFWDGIQGFWEVFGPPFSEFVDQIFTFFGSVFDAVMGIVDFALGKKSFEEMAFGILDAAFEGILLILDLAIKLAVPLMLGIVAFGLTFIASLVARFIKWGNSIGWGKALVVSAALIVAYFYGGAFAVAFLVGAFIVIKWFWKRATAFFAGDWMTKLYERFLKAIYEGIKSLGDFLEDMFTFAHTGGTVSGATIVGERGPELLRLPNGSRVHSNGATKSMLSKGGGSTIINNITINARDTSDGEMRRIADKISSMVNNKINRTTSSRTLR